MKVDQTKIDFIEDVKNLYYTKTQKSFGIFDSNPISFPFQTLLEGYLLKTSTFLDFTSNAMDHFRTVIDEIPAATGGFVIIAHFKSNDEYLAVFVLNNVEKYRLDDLEILRSTILDTEKLDLASFINISKWKAKHERYLSFVKGKKEVSQYFMRFIGCTTTTTAKEQSRGLMNALLDFLDTQDLTADQIESKKKAVHEYCNQKISSKEPISLERISQILSEDEPGAFFSFASSDDYEVDSSISGDKNTLKSLTHVLLSSKDLNISFDRKLLNKTVFYNKQENSLTFTELPEKIKEQLVRGDE